MKAGRRWMLATLASLAMAVLPTTASAANWSAPASIDPGSRLTSVSCASSSFCVAVDEAGKAISYNGSSWSAPVTIDGGHNLGSVSCPSSSFCVAVDEHRALSFNGSGWGAPVEVATTKYLSSVSCPSSAFCMSVTTADLSNSSYAASFNGSSWSPPTVVASGGLWDVSCVSPSFCMASGHESIVVPYRGSWGTPEVIGVMDIPSVSCASTTFCVAGGLYGEVYLYNGTSWSPRHELIESAISSVSCPSSTFCVAVSDEASSTKSSAAFIYNGTTWSPPDNIDTNSLASVSCLTSTFCIAIDEAGNALSYPAPPSEEHPNGGGGSGGSSGGSTSSSTTTPSSGSPAVISSAQIASLLAGQLVPTGKAAHIRALLKSGGISLNIKALEAGAETIAWYKLPPGAKLAKHSNPILVASGRISFTTAGTARVTLKLTPGGKHLLKHVKRLKITARGTFTPIGGAPVAATRVFVLNR